jgi:hypothetical protein
MSFQILRRLFYLLKENISIPEASRVTGAYTSSIKRVIRLRAKKRIIG